jgi:hypothetical protein
VGADRSSFLAKAAVHSIDLEVVSARDFVEVVEADSKGCLAKDAVEADRSSFLAKVVVHAIDLEVVSARDFVEVAEADSKGFLAKGVEVLHSIDLEVVSAMDFVVGVFDLAVAGFVGYLHCRGSWLDKACMATRCKERRCMDNLRQGGKE